MHKGDDESDGMFAPCAGKEYNGRQHIVAANFLRVVMRVTHAAVLALCLWASPRPTKVIATAHTAHDVRLRRKSTYVSSAVSKNPITEPLLSTDMCANDGPTWFDTVPW
jgi:hypothetical protein